jgi:hypothetical protein
MHQISVDKSLYSLDVSFSVPSMPLALQLKDKLMDFWRKELTHLAVIGVAPTRVRTTANEAMDLVPTMVTSIIKVESNCLNANQVKGSSKEKVLPAITPNLVAPLFQTKKIKEVLEGKCSDIVEELFINSPLSKISIDRLATKSFSTKQKQRK